MATYPRHRPRRPYASDVYGPPATPQRGRSLAELIFYLFAAVAVAGVFVFIAADRLHIPLPQFGGAAAPTVRAIGPAPAALPQPAPVIDAAPLVQDAPAQPAAIDVPIAPALLPTAAVARPAVDTIVKPSGQMIIATAPPIVATPWVISAAEQAAIDAVRTKAAPLVSGSDPACNSSNASFVTDIIQVKDASGVPIGEVQGVSCVSEAAAVADVRAKAAAMARP